MGLYGTTALKTRSSFNPNPAPNQSQANTYAGMQQEAGSLPMGSGGIGMQGSQPYVPLPLGRGMPAEMGGADAQQQNAGSWQNWNDRGGVVPGVSGGNAVMQAGGPQQPQFDPNDPRNAALVGYQQGR